MVVVLGDECYLKLRLALIIFILVVSLLLLNTIRGPDSPVPSHHAYGRNERMYPCGNTPSYITTYNDNPHLSRQPRRVTL